MNIKTKIAYGAGVFLVFIVLIGALTLKISNASPSLFYVSPPNFLSSTTPSFMSAGAATTTSQIFDSYRSGTNKAVDSAAILLQFTASSSALSTLKYRYEYSQDGIDWYSDNENLTANATTTIVVQTYKEYSWTMIASSTLGTETTPIARGRKMVTVPVPTRFARVVFYVPSGAASGAIFSQWVTKAQM